MIKFYHRLSRQLSMGIMLMAAPIFILSLGVLFIQSRYLIHQEVTRCNVNILNTTMQRVRAYMGTIETAANSNAWMLEEHFRPDSLMSVSNRIVRLNQPVLSSSVFAVPDMFREYGRSFSLYTVNLDDTVATYVEPEYDYFDRACFTRPVHTGNACWVDPFIDNVDNKVDHNEAIATYCRPLRQLDGRIVGVVTTDFSFNSLARMLSEVEQPYPNAYFMLLGGDGQYLVHPDTTQLFRKTIFTDADARIDQDMITLGHEMTAGRSGTMHVTSNGVLYHVCFQPVPGTNWSLALVCPDSDAMDSFYHLGYVIIVLIVLGLLCISVFCHRIVKKAITPVTILSDLTKKIADGQYDEPFPVVPQTHIFRQLKDSFAAMYQSLKERMGSQRQRVEELRKHTGELEQTLQRTEDFVQRKTQFIRHMTQQIRMPLNVIMGFADVLDEGIADESIVIDETEVVSVINEDELVSIVGMMKDNAINMNRMVLTMFDTLETGADGNLSCTRADEVSCNGVAQDTIAHILGHFPQTDIKFETELQDAIHILTNRMYLLCVLIEPLYNAVNYSDGEHITLHVGQTETSVLFTIQDVGPGMPEGLPEQPYQPFTEVDDMQLGVGIGLSLARRHAVALGGSMTIDPDYHEGCRIVIEMPK